MPSAPKRDDVRFVLDVAVPLPGTSFAAYRPQRRALSQAALDGGDLQGQQCRRDDDGMVRFAPGSGDRLFPWSLTTRRLGTVGNTTIHNRMGLVHGIAFVAIPETSQRQACTGAVRAIRQG